MTAQWAAVDDVVEKYAEVLSRQQDWTTADIAMDMLGSERFSDKRTLAMIAATAIQRLVHHAER